MFHRTIPPCFRFIATVMLSLIAVACDATAPDEDVALALPCNLNDASCAARPGAIDAVELLESMDVDLDNMSVELVESPDQIRGEEPSDGPVGPDTLKSEDPDPQAYRSSCNGNDTCYCCCFWTGPWGCSCYCD
jgi:hypothetical protein